MALTPPSPQRRRLLAAVATAHDAWVGQLLRNPTLRFKPRAETSDYNIHHLDVEASPGELNAMARRVATALAAE